MAVEQKQLFKKVDAGYRFPAMEERILAFWEDAEIFDKSLAKDSPRGSFVFYEGPPTANNLPHPGHVLTRVIKDLIPRFKTMQGHYVRRQAGWDTHGLPVELSVERELIERGEMKTGGPAAIVEYGIEKFNKACFDSVRRYEQEWVRMSNRIGFWLDYENAYFTFTNKYIESCWWILSQIYQRNLLYKGYRIQWYSTLVGTGLSSHEVAQNWQTVKDPSVTVRAQVPSGTQIGEHTAEGETYLLLWTTTPWTLLSNVALCVHPDYDYVVVEFHNNQLDRREYLVLAEALLAANGLESEPQVAKVKGRDLIGLPYVRLFDFPVPDISRDAASTADERMAHGWHVYADTYVTLEDGTGIVHQAPAFGEDDYRIGQREKLPMLNAVDREGRVIDAVAPWAGKWFKDADPDIITDLKQRGLLFASKKYEHNYPHCYRTDAPLMSYPLDSWFIRVTDIKDELVALNQEIYWQPKHIKDGRFGQWLNTVVDWSLSRDRFWGTPLPVWVCSGCGREECLGSFAELQERCPEKFEHVTDVYDQSQFNPHRPFIDEFTWSCVSCGAEVRREPYILDPWFDAGSMPFAQLHYPFENTELIDGPEAAAQYPADFISEAVDQTRGWFYTQLVVSTLLKHKSDFKSCLVMGHITDEKGRKMSKRLGNVVDPWKVINDHGADAFRWYFYSAGNLFTGARFSEKGVVEGLQRFIIPLWNVYSFFTIYANIDGFDPRVHSVPWERLTELDRWIVIKAHRAVHSATMHLEALEVSEAAQEFEALVDSLTNWYVRRSRRRFWQSEADDAKWGAYHTLYNILVTLAKALAPFTPYLSEELYQGLVVPFDNTAPESVHLAEYPQSDLSVVDSELEYSMDQARRVVSLGHAARKESGLRVRQPLSRITLVHAPGTEQQRLKSAIEKHIEIILEELNVKRVEWAENEKDFVSYSYKANFRKLGPKFGSAARAVADWIEGNPEEVSRQLSAHEAELRPVIDDESGEETLRNWLEFNVDASWTDKVDGQKVEKRENVAALVDSGSFDVHLEARPETVAERDAGLLLVLDAHVSPELKSEGLAREVVSRVQAQRKALDLDYSDRIRLSYSAAGELAGAIETHRDYIAAETLASAIEQSVVLTGDKVVEDEMDGMPLRFTVERV